MTEETPLSEVMEKPLSENIIDQMASSEEEAKDVLLMLQSVNPMQAQLINRMLTTLKVTHYVITDEILAEMEDEMGGDLSE